ncbi:type I-E CRISPR-associated protein Cas6/Cse3/CasE [Leucothrix pacifica]|uniref:Type I-E CRISPR-associated protein Cas6/Cse3/CasE n=1 Tax=Leucothrix pacifica TaxID=1247513 RepID=A0A317CVH1_9GAMM|nr:type I-E CRISPR-associated protein Cas6/Cse3/CasE [Leucothrix pacifica]PWR00343.1 type I-E CRISPR-associated protein Cas6/Cse3/CasE [Leucothrix pacifica]
MYLSRMTFNPVMDYQQLAKSLSQDGYREHQALWRLFDNDPEASRDFLYRRVNERGRIKYYILSQRMPVDSTGLWMIDPPKHYDPQLLEGQSLFFTLRVNPVVTISSTDGKKRRHDVVMHEKWRIGFKELPQSEKPALQEIVQTSCLQWLSKRSEPNGFDVSPEQVLVDAYHRHESLAKRQKQPVKYSTVDFQGTLTVTDPELFRKVLFNGMGKSKAFGCGLLLVRRA